VAITDRNAIYASKTPFNNRREVTMHIMSIYMLNMPRLMILMNRVYRMLF